MDVTPLPRACPEPADVLARVHRVVDALSVVADVDLAGGPSAVLRELPGALARAQRLIDAVTARALAALDADGTWAHDGQRSFATWVTTETDVRRGRSVREIARARALRDHLPSLRRELAAGRIGADHIDAVLRHAMDTDVRRAALADPERGESLLAEVAPTMTADQFACVVRRWAVAADPVGAERAWRDDLDAEHLQLAATMGGYHLTGLLTEEHGVMVRTALDAVIGSVSADDPRTRVQRDAEALLTLVDTALGSGAHQRAARIRPHLMAVVPELTYRRLLQALRAPSTPAADSFGRPIPGADAATVGGPNGGPEEAPEAVLPGDLDVTALTGLEPATLTTGTPLAPGQLALLGCRGAWTRVVMGADSRPLDVGREQRIFTAAQTAAIIARDRTCQFPGCDAPPHWCEVHHVLPWEDGGGTNLDNGILLCWSHHTMLHKLRLTIVRYRDRWEYLRPDGRLHASRPRGGDPWYESPPLFGSG